MMTLMVCAFICVMAVVAYLLGVHDVKQRMKEGQK